MVAGKRGSGKSYTLGVISEAISEMQGEQDLNISSLIFDTMGIFWTMKFKNYKDKELLSSWNLEPKNIKTEVFAPAGYFQEYGEKGIPVDKEFRIKLSELNAEDWISLFELNFIQEEAVLLSNIITTLKEKASFNFEDIFQEIEKDKRTRQEIKNSVVSLFEVARAWKIFDEKEGTPIKDLVRAGQTSIIDLSMYSSIGSFNVRALVIGLVCKKLFIERMAARKEEEVISVQRGLISNYLSGGGDMPLVWIFIDEAHEFLVKDGRTPASDALIQLLREGRQPGISLVLATQQPGKIHTDAMTQSDIVLSHKLTSEADVQALNSIMQNYVYEGIKQKMNTLPKQKGSAILLDDNSERIYQMRIRPRFTWHGGEAPSSVKF
jgi:DNA helicase HerA-like ATPase